MTADYLEFLIENLESRRLLAGNIDLHGGVLIIDGTEANDRILVEMDDTDLVARCNGNEGTFDAASVTSIQINTLGGKDRIVIDDDVNVDATINAGDGNDVIVGGGGNDVIDGGNGNDKVRAGGADDTVNGGTGDDKIRGDDGDDDLNGDDGEDKLRGGDGHDDLNGGLGHDRLHGDSGDDLLDGDAGNDRLVGGNGDDDLGGGDDDDKLIGGQGIDVLQFGAGDRLGRGIAVEDELEFEATLVGVGQSTAVGSADFELELEADGLEVEFEVEIDKALANSTYDVSVDGVFVGQIQTDEFGEGSLELSSNPDDDNELMMFELFPTVETGMIVSVVSTDGTDVLEGTFVQDD